MAFFATIGWFAAAYLLFVYTTGGPIACGSTGGCEIVRASRWAYLGPIPQPLLGVAFYSMMFGVLLIRAMTTIQGPRWFWITRVLALVGFVESVALFFLQWLDVRAFCVWCLVSGASATGIALLSLADQAQTSSEQRTQDLRGYAFAMMVLLLVGTPLFLVLIRV